MPEELVKEVEELEEMRKEDQRARLLENKRRYMEEKALQKAELHKDLLKTDGMEMEDKDDKDGKETDEDLPPLQDIMNPEDADMNLFSDEDPLPHSGFLRTRCNAKGKAKREERDAGQCEGDSTSC